MLEGRLEALHYGAKCFAVYGKDEVISDFMKYLENSVNTSIYVRIIAGRDHQGRVKIAITGKIVERLSIEVFRHQFIDDYYSR
ncbi:TPA: hypothetical protein ACIBH9_003949 [Salmonella enterica subsp. diarizonae serovar 61:l,v:z35]